jgi:hypothetical protein
MEWDPSKWNSKLDNMENPLTLYDLIEKTILSHTEETFICTHIYDQNNALTISFCQDHLSIADYKEQFESRI